MPKSADPLQAYRAKRNFRKTPEPDGSPDDGGADHTFVIQKHAATRLHYDFRLELDGVMLSWAVPKGPSYDPKDKRMAIRVEDHPMAYNTFEGTIPPGQYGAGTVIVWDRGTWQPVGDPREGLANGKLLFTLHGQKLAGLWELVRIGKPGDRQMAWLLFKKRDADARAKEDYDVVTALPDSVVTKPLKPAAAKGAGKSDVSPAASGGEKALARLPGAVKRALPAKLAPQLATLSTGVPHAGEWHFEIKLDGYRIMARIDKGVVRLITRGGHDWTSKMPGLAQDLSRLGVTSGWLDGEIVVLGDDGLPSFNGLQNAFDQRADSSIVYFLFDLPFFGGYDLRQVPLRDRRGLLQTIVDGAKSARLRFSADFAADAATILQSARSMGLEGVIAKRGDAPYVSARTETWLKLKCRQRQEFIVCGYTDRGGDPEAAEIGSLLLAVHDNDGNLLSVGSVGNGWDAKTATALKSRLAKLQTKTSPLPQQSGAKRGRWTRRAAGSERWVRPELVVEVSFAEWTPDEQIRHATYHGIRNDKPASKITRELTTTAGGAQPARSAATATKVSNPQRVIDAGSGLTKLDLVRYYESVAEWMLPHLAGRPCSLVRGPEGVAGELFFQKHADKLRITDLRSLDPDLWPGHAALLEVPTARAISSAAQMNVIEFHTWNARVRTIGKPDRMVFDLDPGEGVPWKRVQEAALLLRSFLQDLGLESWLKTSGGKGLHVLVPLAARYDWDTVKAFSRALVQHLARVVPSRFVAKSGPANRVGKIFVDYLRNSHGATTAAAYSARARPGLGVSMPVTWDTIESLKSGAHWTIATAREHLSFHTVDPWTDYWKSRQSLSGAMKLLGFEKP